MAARWSRTTGAREQRSRRAELVLDASQRITSLRPFAETLAAVAEEVRGVLGTGTGLCFASGADGRWTGAVTTAGMARVATADEIAAVEALLAGSSGGARVVELAREPVTIRLSLPPGAIAIVAPPDPHAAAPVVLAAVGDRPAGGSEEAAATLYALGTPAALAIANARLYESLDAAYREQLDLNRQKEEFVSTVSHELRTPVAAIRGTLSTVARVGDRLGPERLAELLEGAVGYGDRLMRIVEELLLVAAGDREAVGAAVETVDVASLLRDVAAATFAVASGRVVLPTSPTLGVLQTDAGKLRTILVHLVENAAKFAPDGPIEVEAVAAGARALFYVTDHGPGIAPGERARVFERFVQLDQSLTRAQGGLGIGLHLSRQLAGLLGGELVVTEAEGGGCCFCLAVARTLVPARETVSA